MAPASQGPERARAAPEPDTLGEQVVAFQRVRTLYGRGDLAGAENALRAYQRSYAQGAFVREASVMSMLLLAGRGQNAEAAAAARAFLAEHPDNPSALKVRSLLARLTAERTGS